MHAIRKRLILGASVLAVAAVCLSPLTAVAASEDSGAVDATLREIAPPELGQRPLRVGPAMPQGGIIENESDPTDQGLDDLRLTPEQLLQTKTVMLLNEVGITDVNPEISGMFTLSSEQIDRMVVRYDPNSPKAPALLAMIEKARPNLPIPLVLEETTVANPGKLFEVGDNLLAGQADELGIAGARTYIYNPEDGSALLGVRDQATIDAFAARTGSTTLNVDGIKVELMYAPEVVDGVKMGPQTRVDDSAPWAGGINLLASSASTN